MKEFIAFPSIEGFHNLIKFATNYAHLVPETVVYRGKIKLHGTNAAVRIDPDGTVQAQSRSQIITEKNDNCGFAKWVKENEAYFASLKLHDTDFTIFGEWCGQGIMKGTAISAIPNKIFAIFAMYLGPVDSGFFVVDPKEIQLHLMSEGNIPQPSNIYVLPWQGESFAVDFKNRESLQIVADSLNKVVNDIEPCDPWVKATFGIEGVAEGLVFVPSSWEAILDYKTFENLTFKAKGDAHKVVHKENKAVQVDPSVLDSVNSFVTMFCTDNRFEQGLTSVGGVAEMKLIGDFLKWVAGDVSKESKAELEASKLTWDQVAKSVQATARTWFIARNKKI